MTAMIETLPAEPGGLSADLTVGRLMNLWLGRLAESSRATYLAALEDFRAFARAEDVLEAIGGLLTAGKASATAVLLAYQADLAEVRTLSPNTVNLRVAAVRSVLNMAGELAMVNWSVKIRNLKAATYRDTRGPGVENVKAMVGTMNGDHPAKTARDTAIVRLLHDLGLRRREVIGLDLEHVAGDRLWVLGKGQKDREAVTMPQQTRDALAEWIHFRGDQPGPLFSSLSNRNRGRGRLTGHSVFQIVQGLGRAVRIKTSPHRIRHTAITTAAGEEGLLAAQKFARHSDPATTQVYVDHLEDLAGQVAKKVAATL